MRPLPRIAGLSRRDTKLFVSLVCAMAFFAAFSVTLAIASMDDVGPSLARTVTGLRGKFSGR